jgi:hypothetical protein
MGRSIRGEADVYFSVTFEQHRSLRIREVNFEKLKRLQAPCEPCTIHDVRVDQLARRSGASSPTTAQTLR